MKLDRRLLDLAREFPWGILLTMALSLAAAVLTVLEALLLSRVISAVFLRGQTLPAVSGDLLLFLGLVLLRALATWSSELAGSSAAIRIKTSLRSRLYAHLLEAGPAALSLDAGEAGRRPASAPQATGELVALAVEGIENLDAYFGQYLPQVALSALVPLTFLFFVFPIDFLSGLILLLTAPLIPFFMALTGSAAQALTRRQYTTLSRMSAFFLDMIQGLSTLKMLGRSRSQTGRIAQVSERYRETTMGVLRVTFLSALVLELVATLSTAVVAVTIGLRVLYARLSFEQAFFVLLLAPEFYMPLRQLGARFHAGMAGIAAAEKLFAVLEKCPPPRSWDRSAGAEEIMEEPPLLPVSAFPLRSPRLRGEPNLASTSPLPAIHFDHVSFTYPEGRAGVQDLTFTLQPGARTALVGPSGAGKSTLASLLLRFLEPAGGAVRLGERRLDEIPPGLWREQLAWVPQRPHLFAASIADNIRLGRPGASLDEVIAAASQANADDFIRELPQGYETRIGERGARLSGGQAQRIALARAFLKDAPLLLLDEPTSSLDPENETLVQQAIDRLVEGRTVLVIAHSLRTVASAGQILVLEAGRVVQRGSHAELLGQDGLYRRLWRGAGHASLRTGPFTAETQAKQTAAEKGRGKEMPGSSSALSPSSPRPGGDPQAGRPALLRLLELLAPYKGWVALSALLGFATIGSSIGLMTTSAYIISAAALHPSIDVIDVAVVGVRFFGLARGIARYLERLLTHSTTFRVLARLRVSYYAALEPLVPARILSFRSGDLLSRLTGDIASLENFFVRAVAPPLVAVLVTLFACLFLGAYHPSLGWALLLLLVLAGLGVPLLARALSRRPGRKLVLERSELSTALVDGIQGMPDLLAFNQGARQQGRVEAAATGLASIQRSMARITGLQSGLASLFTGLGVWVTLALAIPLAGREEISGVNLAVVVLAALTSFEAVQPLGTAAQYLENSLAAARRLFAVVDAPPAVQEPPSPRPLPERFDLEFEDVSFAYSSEGEAGQDEPGPALQDISFSLPQGRRIAIVGPSGAGKSTLARLLLRFWEPQSGSILLGGRVLAEYSGEALRRQIGVISQDTYLFNATLRENLLLARPQAGPEDLAAAVRQAELEDFVRSAPQGLETWAGEGGLRLSGGERQRLAIARALLKDPPVLVLDEPTANLDTLTARRILDTLLQGGGGDRSLILITHRLDCLETMDEILVIDRGRIVERGAHGQLLAAGNLYCRMWELYHQQLAGS